MKALIVTEVFKQKNVILMLHTFQRSSIIKNTFTGWTAENVSKLGSNKLDK